MSKRKKKPVTASQQKITKAQHRNEFAGHLKEILDKAVGPEVFRLIPREEIEKLYKVRCQPVRIKAGSQQDISPEVLKEIRSLATLLLRNNNINLDIGRLSEMSLYDFFSMAFTIILYAERLTENAYTHAAEVRKALAPFAAIESSPVYEKAWESYTKVMAMISIFSSDLSNSVYTLKHLGSSIDDGSEDVYYYMVAYRMQMPKSQVIIDGRRRPVIRLGWTVAEPVPRINFTGISPEAVGLPPGSPLNVHIQSHALTRLTERIDGLHEGLLHFNIILSLGTPDVHKNKKGDLLFAFNVLGSKAGYFKADIIDGQIILRTFLFLTNDGTPEAEKLHANTGIRKEDKIYLTIDKLSTFLNSDIAGNERVKQLFIDAGCESLFTIDKALYFSPGKAKERSVADLIARYLQLDTSDLRIPAAAK